MNVRVTSSWALLNPDLAPTNVWEGDVRLPLDLTARPADVVNEYLFRYLNVVDQADIDRLTQIGYTLPSLSVGDLVTWNDRTYRVESQGFALVTEPARP